MDSLNNSIFQISTLNSVESSKALNPISAERIYFSGPYLLQNWSMPDSVIFYITNNPSSAKVYQKLVQICKYFFIKNPIIIIDHSNKFHVFYFREDKELEAALEKIVKRILSNISYKFWVTGDVIGPTSKIISTIFPRIYKVDNVECLNFTFSNLYNENDSNIPLEKLVEALPKLKKLIVSQDSGRYFITSETMKELIKIEHFSKIDYILFYGLTDTFDIEAFYDYMKKNKHTIFSFRFSRQISVAYKNRLEEIIDEIIETPNHDYEVPRFTVPDIDHLKLSKVQKLCFAK
uniref:Uncharacterized protein n=1 Tax=Panagrolaimus davidi TaxID=227884 RepID=A0A914QC85_9BILA